MTDALESRTRHGNIAKDQPSKNGFLREKRNSCIFTCVR